MDDLRDLKFDPPEFEGNLNPEVFLEWMQSIERFFEIKGYLDDKAFKVALNSKSMPLYGMRTLRDNEAEMASRRSKHGLSLSV